MAPNPKNSPFVFVFLFLFLLPLFHVPVFAAIDHLQLVQQWPRSFCIRENWNSRMPPGPSRFTIHGLWATDSTVSINNQLRRCTPPSFNRNGITGTRLEKLRTDWPNLKSGETDESFWKYEWNEHGTCSSLGRIRFFDKSLMWKNRVDLRAILETANVFGYSNSNDISNAIQAQFKRPRLFCVWINARPNGYYLLLEISLCLDLRAEGFIDCPTMPPTSTDRAYRECPADTRVWLPPPI